MNIHAIMAAVNQKADKWEVDKLKSNAQALPKENDKLRKELANVEKQLYLTNLTSSHALSTLKVFSEFLQNKYPEDSDLQKIIKNTKHELG